MIILESKVWDMLIRGLLKTSFVDYPGEICSTIFVGGCNLRCRFCFNKDLVLNDITMPIMPRPEVLNLLKERAPLVEAVCITGGEPTLQEGLLSFLRDLRRLKLKIKLDTNGTRPRIIKEILSKGLVDYMAMDIKCPLGRYPEVTGASLQEVADIEKTVNLLKESNLNHEFRTTVVPTLLDEEGIVNIAKMIAGCQKYFLQQFRPGTDLLDPTLSRIRPFPPEKMAQIAASCSPYLDNVQIRGC